MCSEFNCYKKYHHKYRWQFPDVPVPVHGIKGTGRRNMLTPEKLDEIGARLQISGLTGTANGHVCIFSMKYNI
jgi:hypothetical protein